MKKSSDMEEFKKSLHVFFNILPIIVGMLLLTSLLLTLFPEAINAGLFGHGELLDSLTGASLGSLAVGQPLASYLLGGELLRNGVGLTAATALMVAWTTVGVIHLAGEALMLGFPFALWRNLVNFFGAVAVAYATVYTLRFLEL